MIYQMQVYYGASIKNKVIYSVELNFNDCTKPLVQPFDVEPYKQEIIRQIIKDGFNPDSFTFDWLTKNQYDNRIESTVSLSVKVGE